MVVLLRLLTGAFVIGLICYFFYCLGRKSALEQSRKKRDGPHRHRKVVESSVVQNQHCTNNDNDDDER